MNEAMCLATDVANEGGHRPKERSRPRGGVDTFTPTFQPLLFLPVVMCLSQSCCAQTLRTLDHSPNAFVLAQAVPENVHTRAHAVTHALSIHPW